MVQYSKKTMAISYRKLRSFAKQHNQSLILEMSLKPFLLVVVQKVISMEILLVRLIRASKCVKAATHLILMSFNRLASSSGKLLRMLHSHGQR